MHTSITDKLLQLAAHSFKIDQSSLQENTPLNAIGDSLDFVDFLSEIESAFGIDITDVHISDVRTVGDLAQVVQRIWQAQRGQRPGAAP